MNKINFSFTTYFLNQKLFLSIADELNKNNLDNIFMKIVGMKQYYRNLKIKSKFEDEILAFLIRHSIKSLEELLLNQAVEEGELCVLYRDLYFKGLTKAIQNREKNIHSFAKFHNRLIEFNDLIVEGDFSPEHITCNTALLQLSGHRRKFIFGYIEEVSSIKIKIRPIIIADRLIKSSLDLNLTYINSFIVTPERIDEFRYILERRHVYNLNELKYCSEKKIKEWFAEIIFETDIQKDWGGEKSDLFTTHIHLDGERRCAAFIFKGPSSFHPMTIKDLGKNGDQIVRLFEEPADIYILQHCHHIRNQVIKHMEAFASRFFAPKYYCVIDGTDTLRILKGYMKYKVKIMLERIINIKKNEL